MLIGGETALLTQMLETIKGAGYETHLAWTTRDTAAAAERNANRGKNNISAYYTERHHRRWLLETMVPD